MRRMIPQNKIEVLDKFNIDHVYDDAVVIDDSIYMSSILGEGDPLISTNAGVLQISADATKVIADTGNAAVVLSGGEAPYVDVYADGEVITEFSKKNIVLTPREQYTERSFSIDTYGIKSPIGDGYTLVFGLNFDGDEGGVHWSDEPGLGFQVSSDGNLCVYGNNVSLEANNTLTINNLPTSDPHKKNTLWNDNGILKISSGS